MQTTKHNMNMDDRYRQIVRWTRIGLAMQGKTARMLADEMNVHESIISRMLAGQQISAAVLDKLEGFANAARNAAAAELRLAHHAEE